MLGNIYIGFRVDMLWCTDCAGQGRNDFAGQHVYVVFGLIHCGVLTVQGRAEMICWATGPRTVSNSSSWAT